MTMPITEFFMESGEALEELSMVPASGKYNKKPSCH